jgi:microcystin degradation protein MlrC
MPTTLADFQVERGRDAREGKVRYPGLDLTQPWGDMAGAAGHEFRFGLMAWADPSGPVQRAAYEALRHELLAELGAAMPVDIVLLNLHGAMVTDDNLSCEEDLLARVRAIAGPDAILAAELDLHCHARQELLDLADVLITYKHYPHVDIKARARELFDLALAAREGRIKPTMALFDCRMVGQFPTTREALRSFVDRLSLLEKEPGVLSISFIHGFRFGDVPHMGAKMLVVTDDDPRAAEALASRLGHEIHGLRREIATTSMVIPYEIALANALEAPRRPVVIADQADNPGSGAPGDSTFALRWLLDHQATDCAIGVLYDPEVVRIAHRAGIGTRLNLRIGGKLGASSGTPVDVSAEVLALRCDHRLSFPQTNENDVVDYALGDIAALACAGVVLVVGSRQVQCYSPDVFSHLGIDPLRQQLIVVKSAQHFHAAFAPIASEILYMSTPGAAPADPRLIPYRHFVGHGFYPWTEAPFAGADAP